MIYTIGIVLIGGHFFLSASVANYLSQNQSGWTFIAFLAYAALSCFFVARVQTGIERFMIRRHINKRPTSSWKVVRLSKDAPQA